MKKCFVNLNLIDGTGNALIENTSIVVEDGVIKSVGTDCDCATYECEVIDLDGQYVMPGLIDSHTHIFLDSDPRMVENVSKMSEADFIIMGIKQLEKQLKSGVVFLRDVGGVNHYDIQLKKHLASGNIIGPDMYCAGKLITMTGGHGHFIGREADGVDEIRKATREQLKAGADVIKVMASGGVMTPGVSVNAYQLNVDEMSAAVMEAHKAGRKVCTHCHSTQGIKNAVLMGIDSIEHCTLLDEEAGNMMAEAGTYMVPTLVAPYFIVKHGEAGGIPKYAVKKAEEVAQRHIESFQMAMEKGINIAMGTDAGTPFNMHGKSAIELKLMVDAGMSPLEAIKTATKNSSELIGIEAQYGTLEAGKYANLIVLSENPVENIETIQMPKAVYKKGSLVL